MIEHGAAYACGFLLGYVSGWWWRNYNGKKKL
jgi:hypothetical protein